MTRGRWTALAALAAALILPGSAAADWAPVQSSQLNAGVETANVSAASVGGVPYFAWAEGPANSVTFSIYAAKVSGGSVVKLGGAVGACSDDPQIGAVGTSVYLACYAENDGGIDVYQLSGSSWDQVGKTIPSSEEVELSGLVGDGTTPTLAFDDPEGTISSEVIVEQYVSGAWSAVGSPLVRSSGDAVDYAQLLGDGSTPFIVWVESDPSSPTTNEEIYADKLSGSSVTPVDGGASLLPYVSTDVDLDAVALVGSTPYVAFDEQQATAYAFDGYVVPLTGSGTPVGGAVVSSDEINPQIALGSDDGAPLALVETETSAGDYEVTAETPSGNAWSQLGSQLGVPPLPGVSGDPYPGEAITDDASGAPYVGILQQPGNTYGEANLFVENDLAGNRSPTAPFTGNPTPPKVTTGTVATAPIPDSVVVFLSGSTGLSRHGKRVTLDTAVAARCPTASGFKACTGTAVIRLSTKLAAKRGHKRTVTVTVKPGVTVKAGRSATIDISLSPGTITKLGGLRHAHRLTGKLIVTLAGPNHLKVSLGQSVSARLG